MGLVSIQPRDIYVLYDFSLSELKKLSKASKLIMTKPEKSKEDTEVIDFLETFLKDIEKIVKDLSQNGPELIEPGDKLQGFS